MWCIYAVEYYSAIKKNEIMPFAPTWMDIEIIILSGVTQKGKDKYHMKRYKEIFIRFMCVKVGR